MDLVDIPVLGKKFSWVSPDGKAMSRLDRFLLSEGFVEKSGISGQWIGDRDISDHCPVWLLCSSCDWGPKPFRVVNAWLEHPDFKKFVESSWKSFNVGGKKAYVLKEKLKLLKESLKKWNKDVFGILDLNIDKTVADINDFESLMANNSRRRRNQLVALRDGEGWVQGVKEVKTFVKNFFAHNFEEEWNNRPNLDGIQFKTLSESDNFFLLAPFSTDEVRDVVWSCDGNKCPGPDGFNFNFLKACWDILKDDIMNFLHEFHRYATLPKAITASFLTLLPKKDHPQALSNYRPICLVGCLYKIVSKVLAARLKKVLGNLISECQSAFLPNRQILDGVLVVNKLIDLAKRRKDNCLLLKVDFERAYDTVNWSFLEYMMRRMGFADGWIQWMRACIFNSSMSVLVNGSPTKDFVVGKGLRQGDPLSPFLFLIAAEGLTGMMQKAVGIGVFHGYKVSDDLLFHTLQFADDTILIGKGNWDNLWSIKTVLRSFELVSGLKINFFKSKLYGINLDDNFLNAASAFLHCGVESIPFRFLGIPVGANPRRKITWNPIVDNMRKRLSSWNGRNLSIGVIAECGLWNEVEWNWRLLWNGDLAQDDIEAAAELECLLSDISPIKDRTDYRKWITNNLGMFSVNSAYCFLQNCYSPLTINSNVVDALQDLWANDVPSKVSIFGWRLLLARLPTRKALERKRIISNPRELCCAFCFREEEDIDHLFFNCSISIQVWKKVYEWLDMNFITFEEVWKHFTTFGDLVKSKSLAKARHVIWLATTWSIWRTRNNIMFRGDVFNLALLVDQIIFISWVWFVGRIELNPSFVFSDWCNDPLACILSI
ncbi:unnamed protein product [Trifolium pratense]|uniref:Uncharacterized protein n=1 Tax=Trifolium pratense TaxID=57577 RepID=A0ACB0I7C0_TRIPR|nr:unnamed protein product [Trifolium pratense]